MTSLEQFLNKSKKPGVTISEPSSGSFSCQDENCNEIINDGYIDRVNSRLHWVCSYGHESSVVI